MGTLKNWKTGNRTKGNLGNCTIRKQGIGKNNEKLKNWKIGKLDDTWKIGKYEKWQNGNELRLVK